MEVRIDESNALPNRSWIRDSYHRLPTEQLINLLAGWLLAVVLP